MEFLNDPLTIKWYLSNQCNLRCKSCYISNKENPNKITQEKIDLILLMLKKISPFKVSLLGGEPTIFPYFKYIISFLEKEKIYFNFSTNGQTLYKDIELIRVLKNSKFLKEVQVSIDGLEKENDFIRGENTFHNAMLSVKSLIKNDIPVILGMVVTQKNLLTLQEFIDFVAKEEIKEIRLIPFIPIGDGEKIKDLYILPNKLKNILKTLLIPKGIEIYTYSFEDKTNTCGCGAGQTSVVINEDLTLSACDLYTDFEKTEVSFNNLENFYKIWKEDKIFTKWRTGNYSKYMNKGRCPLIEIYKEKINNEVS